MSETLHPDTQTMQRVLTAAAKENHQIPKEFMSYLVDFLGVELTIPAGQIIGLGNPIRGNIPATGATATNGVGFSYTHTNGSGTYVFTYDAPFAATPVVLVTPASNNVRFGAAYTGTTDGVTVSIYTVTGVATDTAFGFLAYPIAT